MTSAVSQTTTKTPFFAGHSRSHSHKQPQILKTFTVFPNLPIELRLKIWEQAANKPRIIPIVTADQRLKNDYRFLVSTGAFSPLPKFSWIADCKPPITFSICRESRYETIGRYEKCFAHQLSRPIFFAPKTDVLLFVDAICLESFFGNVWKDPMGETDRKYVRRLAFISREQGEDSFGAWVEQRQVSRATAIYQNLEQLSFVNLENPDHVSGLVLERLKSDEGELVKAVSQPDQMILEDIPSVIYVKVGSVVEWIGEERQRLGEPESRRTSLLE